MEQRDVAERIEELVREEEAELQAVRDKYAAKRKALLEGRPVSQDVISPSSNYAGRGRDSGRGRGRGDHSQKHEKRTDWNCLKCNDFQFARNNVCRKCGAPRPTEEDKRNKEELLRKQEEDRKKRAEEERLLAAERKREEEELREVKIASMSLEACPDCWAAQWVIPYFDRCKKAYASGPWELSVTTYDDDYYGFKDTPLNEAGMKLVYNPSAPAHQAYEVYSWSAYGSNRNQNLVARWSEAEMLYYLSEDSGYHATFSKTEYGNPLGLPNPIRQ